MAHWRTGNLALFGGPQVIHNIGAEVCSTVEGTGAEDHSRIVAAGA